MKPKSTLRAFLLLAGSTLLSISSARAATLYWDGAPASWNNAANWSTASAADTPDPVAVPGALDDAIFNITTVNGAQFVTLDANQSARSLTFNNTGSSTLLGDAGGPRTLTLGTGGITIGASAGAVTLGDGTAVKDVLLSLTTGARTWTNNAAAGFTINNSAASFTRATGATLAFNQAGAGTFAMSTTVLPNDATGIVGRWAFFGTGGSTRYAENNAGTLGGYTSGTAAADANAFASATTNYDLTTAAIALTGSRTANTFRSAGAGGIIDLGAAGANTLTTNGILAVGSGTLTISRTGGTGTVAIGASNELVVAGSQAVTISAPVSGVGAALTYSGTNTLSLNGINTFNGGVNVNSGTVAFGSGAATIAGGITIASGATLAGGSGFGNTLTFSGAVTNNGTITRTANGGSTFSNAISGTGSVSNGGAGQTNLSGNNTFSGGVTQTGDGSGNNSMTLGHANALGTGTFTISSPGNIQSSVANLVIATNNPILVNSNATFAGGNNWNLGSGAVTLNNNRTITVTAITLTLGGAIGQDVAGRSLTKAGTGILVLGGAGGTYSGGTTVSAGTLRLAANDVLQDAGALSVAGTLDLQTFSDTVGAVTLSSGSITGISGVLTGSSYDVQSGTVSAILGGASTALNKTGSAGTVTLSGANTYAGATTVSAGTLIFANQAALYLGNSASWTAANINVKSGATFAVNVDSAGAAGFNATSLNTLIGNISVAGSTNSGMQAGANIGFDTSTATGGTFTQGNAIANSTGAFGGPIGLAKLGAGTLVLDKANTCTGPTAIYAGTLQLDNTGAISTALLFNNGSLVVNKAGALSQGTNFPATMGGTGSLAYAGGGTLTLNAANTYSGSTTAGSGTVALTNALALQNSALVTTSGTSTLSGLTTLTLGGLSGATGDLGSATVLNGYTGTITALTLNPQTGVSVTYGGVISNGSGTMRLTKTGAGTQILTGANTYTGATIINAGTLTLGVGGSLSSSSKLQINGGIFSYGNTAAGLTLNGLAVGAGNSTVSNTAAAQTLALGAITRTTGLFGTVNFATLAGPISTSTVNTNGIIGPWATTGATTTLKYAVGAGNISGLTGTTATVTTLANVTDATGNFEYSVAATTATNLTANTLRYSGGTSTTAIGATNTLTLNGLMQAGSNTLTLSGGPATGGIFIGSTGELVIAANDKATTISAAIGGTGRLVYSGAGSTLTLSSPDNAYTAGTVVNSGTLLVTADTNLGNASGGITLNGGRLQVNGANISSARGVTVNGTGSSMLVNKNNNFTTSGALTGSGPITFADPGGSGSAALYRFTSSGNTYTGPITLAAVDVRVSSLSDTAGNNIIFTGAGTFKLNDTGATAGLTLNNRAIELSNTSASIDNLNTTHALTIGSNLVATGANAKTLTLSAVAGPTNVFSSNINNGSSGGPVGVTVTGTGAWVLSGNLTTTGQITVASTAGLTLSGNNSGLSGNVVLSSNGATGPLLNINSATALGSGILNFGGGAASDVVRINNTSAGALTVSTANPITMNRNFTFVGTQDLNLGTGATTLGGMTSGTNRSITVTAKTLTLGGTIAEAVANLGITKAGAGNLVFSGNNSYTGPTNVNAGKLFVNGDQTSASGAVNVAANATLGGTGIIGGDTTLADNGKLEFNFSTAAGSHDKLELAAGKALGFDAANATLTITSSGGATPGLYTLISAPGGVGTLPTTFTVKLPGGWAADPVTVVSGTDLVINITSTVGGDPYSIWSGGAGFEVDTNGDGVNNGMAWVLGAIDPNVNAISLLPTLDNTTDPTYFIFTYRRKDDADTDPNTTITAQYGSDLGIWNTASPGPNVIITPTNDIEPGIDSVQVKINRSLAVGGKLFARLKAVKAP